MSSLSLHHFFRFRKRDLFLLLGGISLFYFIGPSLLPTELTEGLVFLPTSETRLSSSFLNGHFKEDSFFATAKEDYSLLMNHRPRFKAYRVSLEGKELQSFSVPNETKEDIHYLTKQGDDYFAVIQVRGIHKYSELGERLWTTKIGAHHDLGFDDQGNVFTFDIKPSLCKFETGEASCFLDDLVKLAPNGEKVMTYPLSYLFEPYLSEEVAKETVLVWRRKFERHDPYHLNSLQVLPRDIPSLGKKGDFLVSARNLDLLAVVSSDVTELKWVYQSHELQSQHHARITDNNLISIFDNGTERKRSRVVLLDPATKEITWQFSVDEKDFYTQRHGSFDLLPNGNFLISLGRKALLYEVTPERTIAARFRLRTPNESSLNPYRVSVVAR